MPSANVISFFIITNKKAAQARSYVHANWAFS